MAFGSMRLISAFLSLVQVVPVLVTKTDPKTKGENGPSPCQLEEPGAKPHQLPALGGRLVVLTKSSEHGFIDPGEQSKHNPEREGEA